MNSEATKKQWITILDSRLVRTIPDNITNIHLHLREGNEILAIWPIENRFSVLTKPEHIREYGDKYLAATMNGKGKMHEVFASHVFFAPIGCSFLTGQPVE